MDPHEQADQARDLVVETIKNEGEKTPARIIAAVESAHGNLTDEAVRGAVWSLVNTGAVELTGDGRMRLRSGIE
jgi:hypothetical protein